mmetsp:Transcript_7637/g.28631  ORF Transcript_7637/g.28631 Transcript_7637/m.28631 type:complete len:215 (-) Transcript_7637:217-861(-)|eukprot:CAMPEP_0117452236 /NCGR_PEP_ID=MMETSP0759-20121206/9493_1 /TAXON_ID=63605 /ORGANISM="Percolomonas cosmopolitus, Strain WS" /LENGTH=214 /DNA_ID=CAMNT_0005245009 /DNA_START=89 /DNA_END=733 /DNA_ORIENTATION=-
MKYTLFGIVALFLTLAFCTQSMFSQETIPDLSSITDDDIESIRPARLIVLKEAPEAAVLNSNLTIDITVYNAGEKPAYNVELNDGYWPESDFEIISGSPNQRFEVLNAGDNVTHTYTISGKKLGQYDTAPTTVTFRATEEENAEEAAQIARSTPIPPVRVVTKSEYDRINAVQWSETLVFVLLTLLPIALPAAFHLFANNQIARLADGADLKKE